MARPETGTEAGASSADDAASLETSVDRPELSFGASPAIHTVALAKRFGATTALDSLTMTVPRGEVFGFLGPNGAGKTTAVKLLVGLSRPTSGEAWVLGETAGDR